ncbi:hypothetical protein M409DRAFT_17356 [Zasmidium cellare ATCC 36951]|uniref:Uncharacterized protein n=1 Tax=Zasmidium cellare ATCC 36951 TaxID=1080233 RepID=A0A6A6D377_ZASCE|nr:uncharacterized protein M409DRAFT_17356 [Zasmidium cellare ATCC 36951]KAF2172116.1 hypothetical protein M409DRAFT_17356 [Zasmidium cellare ATCC 36951]
MRIEFGVVLLLPCISAQNSTSPQNATAFALTYGYPLLAFHQLANRFLTYNVSNFIYHSRELSTPDNRTVVKPNVDTLYSTAVLDLSQTDLALTVPDIPSSQYALFSFYDVFGDNYANTGTGHVNGSGQYRIRAPQNGTFQFGVQTTGNGSSNQSVADVLSPTTYGILLIRWGVNASNVKTVHDLQDQTSLSHVNRTVVGNAPNITSLGSYTISIDNATSPAEKALRLLARYAPFDQPETEAGARELKPMLMACGISNGTYSRPSGVDIDSANSSAIQTATRAASAADNNFVLNNGWSITKPGGLAGNFDNGTNYTYRAAIASAGFLQLSNPNAVYPSWANSSSAEGAGGLAGVGGYSLGRDEAIIYTFSSKPPLMSLGFWSLTAYLDNYLIPNDLNVYAIGDRSNITYPDGSLVYGSNASRSNGPFQVLVQAADNPPPSNWTSNWLPGPPGGGNITALLRWYGAEQQLLNGTYQYPVVRRQAAITGSNSSSTGDAGGSNASGSGPTSGSGTSTSSTAPSATSSGPASSSSSSAASALGERSGRDALLSLIGGLALGSLLL